MLENDASDTGERMIGARQPAVDPDDCATMVTREVLPKPAAQPKRALERRIKTIDRIIHALKK